MADATGKIRIDKWLWHARFFKTRSLASSVCKSGKVRLNGQHIAKSSVMLQASDILTFPRGEMVVVIKVLAIGMRRGPASEAQLLYEDITPKETAQQKAEKPAIAFRERGSGRPTKTERRALDKLMGKY